MTHAKSYESFTDWARDKATVITHPIAAFLHRLGFHPNTITILGFVLSLVVAFVLSQGKLVLGGILLILFSSVDALDGALARVSGEKSRFGAFLDSTLDRLSEGSMLLGLLIWLLGTGASTEGVLIYVVMLGSVMVSYTRARAEGIGLACKTGLLTRMERVILLGIGLIAGWVLPVLILMAVLTWFTVGQRMIYVYRESRKIPEPAG